MGGVFKRSIIFANNLFFDEDMKNKEDGLWLMQYCLYARNIAFVEGTCTYYRKHDGQITGKCSEMQWEADSIYYLLQQWKLWAEVHARTGRQKELFWRYRRTWVNGYLDTCSRSKKCTSYNLKATKLDYRTIFDSTFTKSRAVIEFFEIFRIYENIYAFRVFKLLIHR